MVLNRLTRSSLLVRLTVIDTPGFGDYVNNRDSWMPIIEFLDDQHESYMLQEQQPRRQDHPPTVSGATAALPPGTRQGPRTSSGGPS